MYVWMVKIIRNKLQAIFVEPVATYIKIFSTKEKAEAWLVQKGFVYGKNKHFKDTDEPYWFNQSDVAMDHTIVDLQKMEVDSDEKSWVDNHIYRHALLDILRSEE